MRKWSSVAACLAALAFVGAAGADTPPDVYSDFALDGSLSCGHSRAALKGVLTDATIHQYGDPLTFRPQARGAKAIGRELPSREAGSGGRRIACGWDRGARRFGRSGWGRGKPSSEEGQVPADDRTPARRGGAAVRPACQVPARTDE